MTNNISYAGKTVVVTGAASGMGQETAKLLIELGAEVYALDLKEPSYPVKAFVEVNLSQRESIDTAISKLPESIDSIFACAGVAGKGMTPLSVATINFVGHRHLIENLIPRISENGSIGFIASIGGMGWFANLPKLLEFLSTPDFDAAVQYLSENQEDPSVLGGSVEGNNRGYTFSKEATIVYVKQKSWELSAKKIRINSVSPGATAPPMLSQFGITENDGAKNVSLIGVPSEPLDQARALIYINSDEARYISGTDLVVDYGFSGGILTGQGNFHE
ncbi:SDR family oxidoreductase [Paenibacillus barcinonensis]|uniref:NAD(P)-dependent dehydrogenase (Short-subunit alcohol dehydrogenase family) n=1 Tax=Paenibacillus barcinonensis TaxID=198119 RepID=A0A2V4VTD1_PAEBA|nr:SDR family oxidoreductase [Paenibacillus barcinonensis]PYE50050.1 NAD(P)-dependent dehydrogenase (short-subunit alcohol dehydrogenase family) [Paenibacillus barcinonensis]QKS59793.1 SDR family oxidoreductase [Paenibacillus barcinonensis]